MTESAIPSLSSLIDAGLVSALDLQAARTWARIGGEPRDDVIAAAALASRAVAEGHVALALDRIAAQLAAGSAHEGAREGAPGTRAIEWPDVGAWTSALASSPVVHADGEARTAPAEAVRPLVVDAKGRLYLRRYWDHQERLAAAIRERMGAEAAIPLDSDCLADGLERLFPVTTGGGVVPEADSAPDLQRLAAEGALRSRFFVISGGPGTGKTSTVVKILALIVEQAQARAEATPRILLLAPTGKAAAHLQTSVARSASSLECAPAVIAAIPSEASTVHRALGAGGRPTRYRRSAEHPLDADVVLVDEASMVDLALMSRLVDALPRPARLILLGDRDQLASVEAGAVLGDIAGEDPGVEDDSPASVGSGLRRLVRPVVHLRTSHRFAASSDLGALVRAVHAGDAEAVLDLLDDPARETLRRIEPGATDALHDELRTGYAAFASADSPSGRLAALDRYRVLCAHRRGPFGVSAHNTLVERWLAHEGAIDPSAEWYAGRPIGLSRNDHAAGLYNGDVGLVDRPPQADDAALRVLFRTPDGRDRWISPLRVGAAETVFAMTIHKSQGSEFDAVLVVLPDEPSPIVSRELLYTAVSRARDGLCVRASREVIRDALARRVERASGLSDAIWGA
jgi:exodeoxyribonuclease V alpha subunit